MSTNLLATTQGVDDPMDSIGRRLGDEINLSGVSIKMMLELNERYSDVTFRIIVIKAAKGDNPGATDLFTGTSCNRMLDTINKERYCSGSRIHEDQSNKTLVHKVQLHLVLQEQVMWTVHEILRYHVRPRLVKMWVPGTKFSKTGIIKYENGSSQVKFFDYHLVLYAYSNYSTSQALGYNVGRLNDCIVQLHYKEA